MVRKKTEKRASSAGAKEATRPARAAKKAPTRAAKKAPAPKRAREPAPPLTAQAAKDALALETKAIKKLQRDVGRNAWMIGKRLAQIVSLDLHAAGGFASVQDYAEQVLGIGRSTAFQYMRVAQAFSEEVTATFGIQRLERGLAYIERTPEDEKPSDVPTLAVRVPDEDGGFVERPFAEVSLRELNEAVKRETDVAAEPKAQEKKARLAPHAKAIAAANRALDAAVGPADAPRAEVSIREDGGDLVIDVRGVPRVRAAAAMKALAAALR